MWICVCEREAFSESPKPVRVVLVWSDAEERSSEGEGGETFETTELTDERSTLYSRESKLGVSCPSGVLESKSS